MNIFGRILRLTTYGESHGAAVGGVLDGLPARIPVDREAIRRMMAARRPGNSPLTSTRDEKDEVLILSGVNEDSLTLGTPIAFEIHNADARSDDYEALRHTYRPNHADYTWQAKYGIRDHRGGGRASARETAARVAAAALAMPLLRSHEVTAATRIVSIGGCGEREKFESIIRQARENGDSVGGVVECVVRGLPPGIGEPVFDKLQARLAYAMLSIPGVKGFEYGDGFALAASRGSEVTDLFTTDTDGKICTLTNHSGGIQGGISNGMDCVMRVAFKPTPTLDRQLHTVTDAGEQTTIHVTGRHDPCIALRGAVVVGAMAVLTVADMMLAAGLTYRY